MTYQKFFVLVSLSLFAFVDDAFSQLEAGRVVYYSMNGSGEDLSGNAFNSTDFTDTFGPDQFGNPTGAFAGNGVNTYFNLPTQPELKPELPISVAFFVNFNSTAADQAVVFTLDFAQNNHSGLWMNLNSFGGMTINFGSAIGNANSSSRNSKGGSTSIQTGTWYCVVAIARGFNDMDIYIDGVNDGGTYSGFADEMVYTSAPGSIGRKDNDPPPYYLNGSIDDFMLWDRELNLEEIDDLCNRKGLSTSSTHNLPQLQAYPNPGNGRFSLDIEEGLTGEMKVYNALGALVKEGPIDRNVDLSGLENGVYMIRLIDTDGLYPRSVRVVKQ